jgi:hypothetical protein
MNKLRKWNCSSLTSPWTQKILIINSIMKNVQGGNTGLVVNNKGKVFSVNFMTSKVEKLGEKITKGKFIINVVL